jgi:hypothetical protein
VWHARIAPAVTGCTVGGFQGRRTLVRHRIFVLYRDFEVLDTPLEWIGGIQAEGQVIFRDRWLLDHEGTVSGASLL